MGQTKYKLKEKGFDEPCFAHYRDENSLIMLSTGIAGIRYSEIEQSPILAPLYQQVIDWFRENHEIMIACIEDTVPEGDTGWKQGLYSYIEYMDSCKNNIKGSDRISFSDDDSYYNLLNKAIEEALKLI